MQSELEAEEQAGAEAVKAAALEAAAADDEYFDPVGDGSDLAFEVVFSLLFNETACIHIRATGSYVDE